MARCGNNQYIPDRTDTGLCVNKYCENMTECLLHKDYEIHRKIAEAGEEPTRVKRQPKLNELFKTAPNDNKCQSFYPEANCPYPLCDNMDCEEKDDCCLHANYEVKHGPHGEV